MNRQEFFAILYKFITLLLCMTAAMAASANINIDAKNLILKLAIQQVDLPIFIVNVKDQYIYCNKACIALFGHSRTTKDIIGKTNEQLLGKKIGRIYKNLNSNVIHGLQVPTINTFKAPSGKIQKWFEKRQVIFDPRTNKAIGVIGIRVNITHLTSIK